MILFNNICTFLKTNLETKLEDIGDKIALFQEVDIPHDWMIYNTLDLYENSIGWYRKIINKEDYIQDEGEIFHLRFDGVFMDSTLYVN